MPLQRSDAMKGEEVDRGTFRLREERRTALEFNNSFADFEIEIAREKAPTTFVFLRFYTLGHENVQSWPMSAVQAKTLGEELIAYAEAVSP